MAAVGIVVVLLVSAIGFLALYHAIQLETANPEVTDRRTAEREAMRQGGLDDAERSDEPTADEPADRGRSVR